MKNRQNEKGFTFVELSISLIIIGLLIVSILAGSAIIQSARIRSVINDINNYQGSFNLFTTKYGGMPGDVSDIATSLVNATNTACNGLSFGICNGNGDAQITWASSANCSDALGAAQPCSEGAQAWNQLSTAGMVSGSYTGIVDGSNTALIGTNIPSSKLPGAGYSFDYNTATGNHLHFGLQSATGINNTPALNPTDARSIDVKVDDGAPNTGRVQQTPGIANCATGTTATDTYLLSQGNKVTCVIDIEMDASFN